MKHRKHSRRRFHRNPPASRKSPGSGSGVGGTFKNGLVGAVAVLANNFLSNQLGGLLGTMTIPGLGSPKTLVKVAIPVVAGMTIGRRNAMVRTGAQVALAVAIVELIKPMLPTTLGLTGSEDGLVSVYSTNYADGFRSPGQVSGYTESQALPASIAV